MPVPFRSPSYHNLNQILNQCPYLFEFTPITPSILLYWPLKPLKYRDSRIADAARTHVVN